MIQWWWLLILSALFALFTSWDRYVTRTRALANALSDPARAHAELIGRLRCVRNGMYVVNVEEKIKEVEWP